MRQRGRKSASQVEAGAVAVIERADAPLDLTAEEGDEWRGIVDAMPADWFPRETWPLLSQYCRHIVASRRVAQLIDAEMSREDLEVRELDRLLAAQCRETAKIRELAASMRLAQQSTWTAKSGDTAKQKRTVKRLWEG